MRAAAIAFLGGILVVQQFPALPSPAWLAVLFLPVALAWRHPRAVLVILFLVAGASWLTFRAGLILEQTLPEGLEGRDLIVEGFIADIPTPGEYGLRFEFDVAEAALGDSAVKVPRRILLSNADPGFAPRVGERWRMTVRLKRPHGFRNPGGFDYEAHLFRKRIRARGYVRDHPAAERLDPSHGLRYAVGRVRQGLGERLRAVLGERAHAGLIVALANGDTRGITDAQWNLLRRTGTVHLVAISGLHISLVAGLVFFLARFAWAWPGYTVLRVPAPIFGAVAGFLAAAAYAALAGFVIPTQRALVMLAVALGAIVLRRRWAPSTLLATALLLVLVHDPLAVMAPGFWLSFVAVAAIVYAVRGDQDGRSLWRKWGHVQWAVGLGMLPLLLGLFQQASLVSPLANLLAVPAFDLLVVPLTLLGAALIGLGQDGIAPLALVPATWLLDLLWSVLGGLADLPYAQWTQHRPADWALACAVVGTILLLAPRGWPARAVGVVWLLPLFLVRPPAPAAGEMWFTLLDVGQGLAAVVRTHAHSLVFDTGARFSSRFDAGSAVVVPYLQQAGIRSIDVLVVSHGDNDHAGGAPAVLAAFPVSRTLSGSPEVPGTPCRAGQAWRWDGVDFAVLGPPEPLAGRHNDGSCVLRVSSANGTVLLSGDIERRAEEWLLEAGVPLAADVLVAPHHGSRTSSTPGFLEKVRPRHVLFPVGYRNRYRHPHPDVVARYEAMGARLYDTPSGGALELRFDRKGITATGYRERERRYWHARPGPP
ncbi:competence protein ComEC [Sulfurifustis variabilis]|uniref:Competence protein ComEC n=1 Tax=Sulfurifustis variabilis TaxID=1675686 RepID=A0A1B4V4I9_9GAMM|nr:DNA internalization-related competence protein ComEC/Rec2 [Sulfurifustis variabilis]BAU48453.1 competence protein ComEC [Sulfurifustis variabilis]